MTKYSPLIRYFVGTDNSGHSYVIPVSRRAEWEQFLSIPEDDEASWDVPKWATQIDGVHTLTFADWAEGDGDVTYAR